MRFFEPSEPFLDWLAAYAGERLTFDVGCGEGHITRALDARGVKVLGIDPAFSSIESRDIFLACRVLPMFAEKCSVLQQTERSLVLFCRPCHGGFVERV